MKHPFNSEDDGQIGSSRLLIDAAENGLDEPDPYEAEEEPDDDDIEDDDDDLDDIEDDDDDEDDDEYLN